MGRRDTKGMRRAFGLEVVGIAVFLSFYAGGCKKKDKKEKIPSSVQGVPVHPRSSSLKVLKDEKNHLVLRVEVKQSTLQTLAYYRQLLRSRNYQLVEDHRVKRKHRLVAVRGQEYLQLDVEETKPGVAVRIQKRRLEKAYGVGSKKPPKPDDVPLPKAIRWDSRFFAAPREDVEIRGRCRCAPKKARLTMKSALEAKKWKVVLKAAGWIEAKKGSRTLKVVFKKLNEKMTRVGIVLNVREITGEPPESREAPRSREEDERRDGGVVDAKEDQEAREPSWSKNLEVKLPDHWKGTVNTLGAMTKTQRSFFTKKKDLAALEKEVTRALKRKRWKPMKTPANLGLRQKDGSLLIFTKKQKTLTARLFKTPSGCQLVIILANK